VIASLRKPDGTLDVERYRQLLGAQGMTPEMFESPRAQRPRHAPGAGRRHRHRRSRRGAGRRRARQLLRKARGAGRRFKSADYKAKVEPDRRRSRAFYKDNGKLFQAPEQATSSTWCSTSTA
jgi:peptidyl-prolyl cis-trans isomerase D